MKPVDAPGGILLVSCYELGQQPLGVSVPAAHLQAAGFEPTVVDIAVDMLSDQALRDASLIAVSVPMHTALRLGSEVARRARRVNPGAHICFYGIYAELNARRLAGELCDTCLGAEFEDDLVALAEALRRHSPFVPTRDRKRRRPLLPRRDRLPPIERYVHLERAGQRFTVGSVVTTRGCKHTCRHCPLTPVYNGRFYAIPVESVLADVAQLVDNGAQHVTFADPDFLNGPAHALRVAQAVHERFATLTFDFTAKIEHLWRYRPLVDDLQRLGCVFVVSAVETFNDHALEILDKGHTREEALDVIRHFRHIGLTLRPSFVPFMPWTSRQDYLDLLEIVEREQLIDAVDPIQYTIRLLVPTGSALERSPHLLPHLGQFDADRFTWRWHHPDATVDELQRAAHDCVERSASRGEDTALVFQRLEALARDGAAGEAVAAAVRYRGNRPRPPRLTENWFC